MSNGTKTRIQRTITLLNLPWKSSFFFQNTMTDSTILLEDVQKMKDKGEIAQAYIGLKETNRYTFSTFHLQSFAVCPDILSISCSIGCIHLSVNAWGTLVVGVII